MTTYDVSAKALVLRDFGPKARRTGSTFTTQEVLRRFRSKYPEIAEHTVRHALSRLARGRGASVRRIRTGVYEVTGEGRPSRPRATTSPKRGRARKGASAGGKPVWKLVREFSKTLSKRQIFRTKDIVGWFAENHPEVKRATIIPLYQSMAVNNPGRIHHASVRPGNNRDLFFNEGQGRYRRWDKKKDPPPIYRREDEAPLRSRAARGEALEFQSEAALQFSVARNLEAVEPGLKLWSAGRGREDEKSPGVEFDTGEGRIDILAVDKNGNLVVIELKVSTVKPQAVGQILAYIGWVEENLAEGRQKGAVRGIILGGGMRAGVASALEQVQPRVDLKDYALKIEVRDSGKKRSSIARQRGASVGKAKRSRRR